MSESRIHVVAGVIFNEDKRCVLLSRRPEQAHQGGLWEFPGGKKEAMETAREALNRELLEELNLTVENADPLISIQHDYSDLKILLDVYVVNKWTGSVRGNENQAIQWVQIMDLDKRNFPEANNNIIKILQDRFRPE